MSTIFERVGGEAALKAAVSDFYQRVLADERLSPFFAGFDTDSLMEKQRAFLAYALGGADTWNGAPLRDAHAAAVDQGLTASHFAWTAKHLSDTLESLDVDKDLISEILEVVASTQNDVLGL